MNEKITNIKVKPYQSVHEPTQVAYLSFTYDNFLILGSIKVHLISGGEYRLEFPGRKMPDGKVFNTFWPAGDSSLEQLTKSLLPEIKRVMDIHNSQHYDY